MGRRYEETFVQKGHTDGKQTYEKKQMPNITNYQETADQNLNKIPPHTCQKGYYQEVNKQQVLVRIQKEGNPCALLVELKIGIITLENKIEVPQKVELPYYPAN